MDNQKIIDQLLEDYNLDADPCVKQAIADFSIMYAQKFIRKCIDINGKKLNLVAVRNAYEILNKVHSTEFQAQLQQKRQKIIKKVNEQPIKDTPQKVNTVNLYYKNKIECMRTNNEYQITFDTTS